MVIGMLTGDSNPCDVPQTVYDGQYQRQPINYQGYRDQMALTNGFMFDLAMIALSVQVGYTAMPLSGTFQPWINIQSNYLRQIESALNRIMQFDQTAKDNSLWNAQRNMNSFVKTNVTQTMNMSEVSEGAQQFLTKISPSYRWMIYTYTTVQSAQLNSWRCQSCFVTLNANGAGQGTFNILVIGVPLAGTGNTTLLSTFTSANTVDAFTSANTLTEQVYTQSPCLGGAFSTYGG